MAPQRPGAQGLRIVAATGQPDHSPHRLDQRSASLRLVGDGRLIAARGAGVVRFSFPAVPPDRDLLHPHLASAAALVWQWAGREALHAGAVAVDGGAVLILGGKKAGKSSTLWWLASERGADVLTDDLAIVDDGRVHVGPRCIDLRSPVVRESTLVRDGGRSRVRLAPADGALPIIGSVVLAWGSAFSLAKVPAAERLPLVARQRYYPPLSADSSSLLELVSKPMLALTRPRGLAGLPDAADALLGAFS
jgi:hypothetical protein